MRSRGRACRRAASCTQTLLRYARPVAAASPGGSRPVSSSAGSRAPGPRGAPAFHELGYRHPAHRHAVQRARAPATAADASIGAAKKQSKLDRWHAECRARWRACCANSTQRVGGAGRGSSTGRTAAMCCCCRMTRSLTVTVGFSLSRQGDSCTCAGTAVRCSGESAAARAWQASRAPACGRGWEHGRTLVDVQGADDEPGARAAVRGQLARCVQVGAYARRHRVAGPVLQRGQERGDAHALI